MQAKGRRRAAWTSLAAGCCVLLLAMGVGHSEEPGRAAHDSFLAQAVRQILDEAAGALAPVPESTSGGEETESPAIAGSTAFSTPPEGAAHHGPGREAVGVSAPEPRRLQGEAKEVPGTSGDYFSNSTAAAAGNWRQLGFASGSLQPPPGLDPRLAAVASAVAQEGRKHVYGFVLLNEHLRAATRAELERLGVALLGPHGSAHKARLPADAKALDRVAGLAYVEWIGLSTPEQKVSTELRAAVRPGSEAPDELPVVVNLFENVAGFREKLEQAGAVVGRYDTDLTAYRAVVTRGTLDTVVGLDFVLYVELVREMGASHDQSMPLIGMDYIRPGAGGSTFDGATTTLGIMDSGFMLGGAAAVPHVDLNKNGCGFNFTTDAAGVWNDENGHGTHVLATAIGTGTGNSRYKGAAVGVGNTSRVRAAKVFRSTGTGSSTWTEDAMDFMDDATACDIGPRPHLVSYSGGGYDGTALPGTDSTSRKLDEKTWTYQQLYVVANGNDGPGASTAGTPAVAKDALAVGNVQDYGYLTVGDIWTTSSRGPTADGRMKPNLSAPGRWVTSADAGTTNGYLAKSGTSMATPHVSGLAATLMQHYTEFQNRPYLLRAHMMASSVLHDDVTTPPNNTSGGRNDYGLGRVSAYASHWAWGGDAGWSTSWWWGSVSGSTWMYGDLTVPAGADRLVVVLTWDEPAASAGAARAVLHDIDLWIDRGADCGGGQCGEYASQSNVDNTEYLIINNPTAGLYRLKAFNWDVTQTLPVGIAAMVILGDPTPAATLTATPSTTTPVIGTDFTVTTTVANPAYVAASVHLENTALPAGVTRVGVRTTREDGILNDFGAASELTLGDIHAGDSRSAVWTFRLTTAGTKTLTFRSWSENGGTATANVTVVDAKPDLQVTALSAPSSAQPGDSVGVANTVRNLGQTTAPASILRIYLSGDSACSTGDTYLPPERDVPSLAVSGTSAATTTVTIPADTPLGDRHLCAIADYNGAIAETDETNNARSTPISIVRPDLQVTALTGPATAAAGASISVSDTVRNLGTAPAGASVLRLYLSTDTACATSDTYLPPERPVGSLPVSGTSPGTTTVTIPLTTSPGVRYVCAIADYNNAVAESNEGNNTRSYAIAVTPAPPPTVDLEINGQDAAYPMFVTTPGPLRLTIDMTAGTTPVDHYYAIIFGTAVYWLDPSGRLVTTPTSFARFTPVALNDVVLLDADLGAAPGFWGFAWIMIDGATVVSSDVILANVTGAP